MSHCSGVAAYAGQSVSQRAAAGPERRIAPGVRTEHTEFYGRSHTMQRLQSGDALLTLSLCCVFTMLDEGLLIPYIFIYLIKISLFSI